MQVLVPVGTPRLQTLTLLERLRSLQKAALSLVDTVSLRVFFIDNPTTKQSQAPAEPLPYPCLSKMRVKKVSCYRLLHKRYGHFSS